jgi:PKHD-type hydroxylase
MKINYQMWKSEIPFPICDAILQEFSAAEFEKGLVKTSLSSTGYLHNIRNNEAAFAPPKHILEYILFRYAIHANKSTGWHFDITDFQEPIQISKYKLEEYYSGHIDSMVLDNGMQRKLTCILLLSDQFEGGDLKILNEPVGLKKGDVIVFPSFLFHEVAPVTKGERWSVVGWISGPKFV